MSENRSVLILGTEGLLWQAGGAEARSLDDAETRQALRAETARRDHRVVFAAPGGEVRLTELALAPEERRHLDTSLPFMLEESVAEDVEALHFARELIGRDRCAVAIVAGTWMERWSEELGEFAARVPWIPEPLLLPWDPGEWTLVFDGASVLLRTGAYAGTRIEAALLGPLLEALQTQAAPERVVVYGHDEAAERAALPDALDDAIAWRRGGLAAALLVAGDGGGIDLRQGSYAPQLPYARVWHQWRAAAALVAVGLVLHLLSGWLDLRRLERENLALRGEIQSVYREVNPRGAVVDAERQLQRQLSALRGGGSGGSFTELLAPLAARVTAASGLRLASLTYSQGRGELRINLLAPDFAAVESLRSALAGAGVNATLENSSRSGDEVRARLRIGVSS